MNDHTTDFLQTELEITNKQQQKYLLKLIDQNRTIEIKQYIPKEKYEKLIDFFKIHKKANKSTLPLRIIEKQIKDDIYISKLLKTFFSYSLSNEEENFKKLKSINCINQRYKKEYECLKNLPVHEKVNEIIESIDKNQIVIIEGNTGCGKSTQIPKLLLNYYNTIIVSQPRKIAAISLAERVSYESNTKLGEEIGYQVRFQENHSINTKLLFITDGMLIIKMSNFYDNPPSIIIIDEAHERTLSTDLFIAYVKKLLEKNKNLKLILMSATLSINKFIEYFNCPVIKIEEKLFENKIIYAETKIENYLIYAENLIIKITKEFKENENILVFLPGIEDINILFNNLYIKLKEIKNIKIYKFHAKIPLKNQEGIFKDNIKNKIILATNIAETSLTINNLKYVIDSGYVKENNYNYNKQINYLIKKRISKSQAIQRSGRVGRISPGIIYRLYTLKEYNDFEINTKPEIFTNNLNELLLNILKYKIPIQDFLDINFNKLVKSAKTLFYLKFINEKGLTKMGEVSNFLRPEYFLIVLKSFELNVFKEVIKIIVVLTIGGSLELNRFKATDDFFKATDDFRACILEYNDNVYFDKNYLEYNGKKYLEYNDNVYFDKKYLEYNGKKYLEYNDNVYFDKNYLEYNDKKYNGKNYLKLKKDYKKLFKQIYNSFKTGITDLLINENKEDINLSEKEKIDLCIATGLFLNSAIKKDKKFFNCINDTEVFIPPNSLLFNNTSINNEVLIYDSVMFTKKEYISIGMFIDYKIIKKVTNLFRLI